jgi:hypothetical protein
MGKIKINDKEYETEDLSDQAKQAISMLAMTDNKIRELQRDINICQAAQGVYTRILQEQLPKEETK